MCVCTVTTTEIIVLSEGHNVAPVPIEARIKQEIPFLSNVVLVGDGQDHLCCLVTLKVSAWTSAFVLSS